MGSSVAAVMNWVVLGVVLVVVVVALVGVVVNLVVVVVCLVVDLKPLFTTIKRRTNVGRTNGCEKKTGGG